MSGLKKKKGSSLFNLCRLVFVACMKVLLPGIRRGRQEGARVRGRGRLKDCSLYFYCKNATPKERRGRGGTGKQRKGGFGFIGSSDKE